MGLRGVSILVIEDAPDVLSVFTTLLRLEGADAVGPRTESTRWRSLASIGSTWSWSISDCPTSRVKC